MDGSPSQELKFHAGSTQEKCSYYGWTEPRAGTGDASCGGIYE